MTLHDFLSSYGGNNCISIDGYCEEWSHESVMSAEWYEEIKDRTIGCWQTIGGGMYKVEICITLK